MSRRTARTPIKTPLEKKKIGPHAHQRSMTASQLRWLGWGCYVGLDWAGFGLSCFSPTHTRLTTAVIDILQRDFVARATRLVVPFIDHRFYFPAQLVVGALDTLSSLFGRAHPRLKLFTVTLVSTSYAYSSILSLLYVVYFVHVHCTTSSSGNAEPSMIRDKHQGV